MSKKRSSPIVNGSTGLVLPLCFLVIGILYAVNFNQLQNLLTSCR